MVRVTREGDKDCEGGEVDKGGEGDEGSKGSTRVARTQ